MASRFVVVIEGTFMTTPHRIADERDEDSVASEVIEAGAVAGLVGGMAMWLCAATYTAAVGRGFWTPVKAIAEIAVGARVYEMGARAALIGMAIHLFMSMAMGVLFASVTPRDVSPAPALALGAVAGVAILVLMNLLVLQTYDWTDSPGEHPHLMWCSVPGLMPLPLAFVIHLIYGAGLALAPGLRRWFRERSTAPDREDHGSK
jgi:hypothetical protein